MDELMKDLGFNTNGIKYDDMTKEERDVLYGWLEDLQKGQLTIEKVKLSIKAMRDAVEEEVTNTPETETAWLFFQRPSRKAVLLKARLKNYMMIEALLDAPERARRHIENALGSLKS